MGLTHLDEHGSARMVDFSEKPPVKREARAEGRISLGEETLSLVKQGLMKKGDVLAVARIAGIQAAKKTVDLIPLCHQIPLSLAEVEFELEQTGVLIKSRVSCTARTGVEMEALTAVSVAALTIYDMCKAVDKQMCVSGIRLVEKTKGSASC